MAGTNAFLPLAAEQANYTRYQLLMSQLQDAVSTSRRTDRAARLQRRYLKHPWLSPGVATAYTKWEEQYGTQAAQSLARTAFDSMQTEGATRQSITGDLEELIATKDFHRQVKSFRDGDYYGSKDWFASIASQGNHKDTNLARKAMVEKMLSGGTSFGDVVGAVPGVGPALKGVSRAVFTGLESGYQEVQAAGSSVLAHTVGAFQDAAQSTATGRAPTDPTDPTLSLVNPAPPENGLIVGNQAPFGTSVGAIALQHILSGGEADLGEGFFPGGEATKEHERAVRNIAAFKYGGEKHFATPGRIFAAAVTEPGTDPWNALSGSLDALAIIKGDPALLAGGKLEDIRAARKGFTSDAEAAARAGGITDWMWARTHGPTVDVFLDERNRGQQLVDTLTNDFAGHPEKHAELQRLTGWKWPAEVVASIINTPEGHREGVRSILGAALGASIPEQPRISSFAAAIRNVTQQHRFFAEIPSVSNDLDALSGPNGSLRSIYNHGIGIGLSDEEISTHLHTIAAAPGKVERSQAIVDYMNMEGAALRKMGLPDDEWRRLSSFAMTDLHGKARIWYDNAIARGDDVPGVIIDGKPVLTDGPFLQQEYLGNRIWLPPLQGPEGRNRAIVKYGRILGIPGTGYTELDGVTGAKALADSAWRATRSARNGANIWMIDKQNKIWKPVALLRGAWTLRVIGEEQIRMAMAGYDSLFNHPIRYIARMLNHGAEGSSAEKALLEHAADQGALRHAQEASFGLNDPQTTAYGRIVGRNTRQVVPGEGGYGKVWADKIILYHEDDLARAMANELTGTDVGGAVASMKDEFWNGTLAGNRADLSTSESLAKQGFNLATRHGDEVYPKGADDYIDDLFDRVHYYTGGDPKLIETMATGRYSPDLESIAASRSLKGRTVNLDGAVGEVVEHRKGAKNAVVLFEEDNNAREVAVKQLALEGPDQPAVLTRTADNQRVDNGFVSHLDSHPEEIKPAKVSGTVDIIDPYHQDVLDRAVRHMFSVLMDRPTTYMSRSQTFLQAYLDELQRLLPHMESSEQRKALGQARALLHQTGENPIRGRILVKPMQALEDAAKVSTVDGLGFDEVDDLAKSHGLDTMRELLYDAHKKNRTLAAMQLVFPFGEAFKEMVGSWGRIIAEKPITTARKFQITVNAAEGANPFDYIPGGTALKGRGFFYKDPARQGAMMFAYPFSGAVDEGLFGVSAQQTAPVEGLSMGLQLMPGVGPVIAWPGMQLLDRFMSDPKWDPLRQFVNPYGSAEPTSLVESFKQQFIPSWARKWMTAIDGDIRGNTQSAKALNSLTSDVLEAGVNDGTYKFGSRQEMQSAFKDAYDKAKLLYIFQGTFQFGAPAAPSFDFYTKVKNGKVKRFVMLRDAYYKLVDKDRKNNTHDAAATFYNRFGEKALYVVGPKTLGGVIGQEYTERQYDWTRRHPDVVSKYPLTYPEFAPRPTAKDDFSYDAWQAAYNRGEKTSITGLDTAKVVNDLIGGMWYDNERFKLGLKSGEAGTRADQQYLADVRTQAAKVYPGFREFATRSKTWLAVEELTAAAKDPALKRSNPQLIKGLNQYLNARGQALQVARGMGRIGDFQHPGFASSGDTAFLRTYLRDKARSIGDTNPQFYALWQDTFDREMKDDN